MTYEATWIGAYGRVKDSASKKLNWQTGMIISPATPYKPDIIDTPEIVEWNKLKRRWKRMDRMLRRNQLKLILFQRSGPPLLSFADDRCITSVRLNQTNTSTLLDLDHLWIWKKIPCGVGGSDDNHMALIIGLAYLQVLKKTEKK